MLDVADQPEHALGHFLATTLPRVAGKAAQLIRQLRIVKAALMRVRTWNLIANGGIGSDLHDR